MCKTNPQSQCTSEKNTQGKNKRENELETEGWQTSFKEAAVDFVGETTESTTFVASESFMPFV